jgi:hypothetical protein
LRPRKLVALAVALVFSLTPLIPFGAAAPLSSYSEKLTIYTAGSSAFWYVRLNGVNATNAVAQADASTTLTGYAITAVKTIAWVSDFQVFGPAGYNLLKLPFIPDQGLFLTVNASTYQSASSVAMTFDQYLGAAFSSLSNRTGTFTFFSPLSFGTVVPQTLLALVPRNSSGFAALAKASSFAGLPSPFVTLTSQKTSSGFTHSLAFGSARSGVFDQSGALQLLSLFTPTTSFKQEEKFTDSSTIVVHSLDGLISSNDRATVTDNRANFSGYYSYSVPQKARINKLNLTVLELPAVAVGTRILDKGAVNPGDSISVTLNVKNVANLTIQNFTASDNWWQTLPNIFQLTNGQSNFTIPSISPGSSASRTYVLKVNSAGRGQILVPPLAGHFSYKFGSGTFDGSTSFNPLELLIGQVGPSISITTSPDSFSGKPIGAAENLVVTVTNFGNSPALNLRLGNFTSPSLAQGGQTWVLSIPVQVAGLTHTNISRTFGVTWQTSGGQVQNTTSNLSNLVFSHSAMVLGYGRTTLNGTLTYSSPSAANLTLKYSTVNNGEALVKSFVGVETLPAGLGCGKVTGTNASCSNGVLTLSYTGVKAGTPISASVSYILKQAKNFVIPPANFNYTSGRISFGGSSGAFAVPAGLLFQKSLNPSPVIQGMQSRLTLSASNLGPFAFYNATLYALPDSFDSLPSTQPATQKFFPVIRTGNSVSLNFSVNINPGQVGNRSLSPAGAQFLFAGTRFSLLVPQATTLIYLPVQVTMPTSPSSPIEGNTFNVILSISNRAGVDVTNVQLTLPFPTGVQVVRAINASAANGVLRANINRLPAMSLYKANITLKANAGLSFGLPGGSITFSYAGTQIRGVLASQGVTVSEDVLTRYTLPVLVAILAILATTLIVRRRVSTISPASQRQTPQKQP